MKVDSSTSLLKPIALEETDVGAAPKFSATTATPSSGAAPEQQHIAMRSHWLTVAAMDEPRQLPS